MSKENWNSVFFSQLIKVPVCHVAICHNYCRCVAALTVTRLYICLTSELNGFMVVEQPPHAPKSLLIFFQWCDEQILGEGNR